MAKQILFCESCKVYTMKEQCPRCSAKTNPAKPPKYSPKDKYASYRREEKKKDLQEKGLY